jgi:hypothetical protein
MLLFLRIRITFLFFSSANEIFLPCHQTYVRCPQKKHDIPTQVGGISRSSAPPGKKDVCWRLAREGWLTALSVRGRAAKGSIGGSKKYRL